MGQVEQALMGMATAMIDTCCFIYHIESECYPEFAPFTQELFTLIRDGRVMGMTSPITLTEIMSLPRRLGLEEIAYRYKLLLVNFPNLSIPVIDVRVADKAAALRGLYNLKTPDALQVATGLVHRASAFVTFDREIARVAPLIKVITLPL